MDARLLEILVCPLCKGPLKRLPGGRAADGSAFEAELLCQADRLAFPVRDGIPVMLVDEARKLEPDSAGAPPTGALESPTALPEADRPGAAGDPAGPASGAAADPSRAPGDPADRPPDGR